MTNQQGIHRIRLGYVNAFVIDGDQGVVLIDTGLPRKEDQIAKQLAEIGRSMTDIRAILITHAHTDHAGSAAAVKAMSGAPLSASPVDAPAIRGDERPPLPPMFRGFLSPIGRMLPAPPPVEVDHMVSEHSSANLPEDLEVIDTPGHTPGHVCFLLDRSGGVLFAGDAAVSVKGEEVAKGYMNRRDPEWDASIRHLAERKFSAAHFGHSGPIESGAAGAFRRFAERL